MFVILSRPTKKIIEKTNNFIPRLLIVYLSKRTYTNPYYACNGCKSYILYYSIIQFKIQTSIIDFRLRHDISHTPSYIILYFVIY